MSVKDATDGTAKQRRKTSKNSSLTERLAYSPTEAAEVVPFGRTQLYAMMADGRLRYKEVGGRRIIPASELHRLFCEFDDQQGQAA